MYNYGSNYPTNSGPPPPGMGGGGYGGYPGGMLGGPGGGGFGQQSAYNVNQYPGGGGGGYNQYQAQGGAVPGFTAPAQYGGARGGGNAPPPQAPPASMQYTQMQNVMSDMSMQNMQWKMYQNMGLIEEDEDDAELKKLRRQRRRKNRRKMFKGKKNRRRRRREEDGEDDDDDEDSDDEDDDEDEGGDDEEEKQSLAEERKQMEERARRAEEKARELQEKLQNNDELKEQCRGNFINELLRRQTVSGTFEETQGTVFPFEKYEEGDPVVKYFNKKKNGSCDITGEDWDPLYDSEYLRKGMKGIGTNEQAIIDIISTRSNSQRNTIFKEYKTAYGRDLVKDLRSELSGDFKDAILGAMWAPARYDALTLKRAIYGAGTDERALIEVLMTRTNAQIAELVDEYNKVTYEKQKDPEGSLEKDIIDDTSGDFKRLLISAAQGNRRLISQDKLQESVEEVTHEGVWSGMFRVNYEKLCNVTKCKRMAEELFKAGEDRLGTDEETFNKIFSTQDYYTLRVVWDEYVKLTQRDILNSIDRETSSDFKHGLRAIAQNIKCRPMFFAERLYKSMKGAGTDDNTLIRIIMSRSEIDMVQIKACFLQQYSQTLWNFVKDDTSGDYRKLLLAIVGRD